jgi:hypothetical protein
VVLCLAAAPPSLGENEPWLDVRPAPPRVLVHGGTIADAVFDLEIENTADFNVKVKAVTAVFLDGDRAVASVTLDRGFFKDEVHPRPTRIHRGERVEWRAICLEGVPPGADRIRLDLDLATSRGLRRSASSRSAEIGLDPAPEPPGLRLPFEGYWRVSQGHTCSTNHRVGGFGSDYAWDFAAVGSSVSSEAGDHADAYGFGRAVLAPADGRVLRVIDDVPDNEGLKTYPRKSLLESRRRPEWIFGNFVVLDIGDGAFALLAHLEQGSILVEPGQRVRAGDRLAACGNSGNTVDPHVHLQVMDRPDPADPDVRGLPAVFVDFLQLVAVGEDEPRDLLVTRMSAGDPPEWSIVAPAATGQGVPRE